MMTLGHRLLSNVLAVTIDNTCDMSPEEWAQSHDINCRLWPEDRIEKMYHTAIEILEEAQDKLCNEHELEAERLLKHKWPMEIHAYPKDMWAEFVDIAISDEYGTDDDIIEEIKLEAQAPKISDDEFWALADEPEIAQDAKTDAAAAAGQESKEAKCYSPDCPCWREELDAKFSE